MNKHVEASVGNSDRYIRCDDCPSTSVIATHNNDGMNSTGLPIPFMSYAVFHCSLYMDDSHGTELFGGVIMKTVVAEP